MWMNYDQTNENANGRSNETVLLRCPMCRGRGYFEPSQAAETRTSELEVRTSNSLKLPSLQPTQSAKEKPKPRYKYSLPSIKSGKKLEEHTPGDFKAFHKNFSQTKRDILGNVGDVGSTIPSKSEPRITTGKSQALSVASSNDSCEKNFIPSPKTPTNPSETLKTCLAKLKTNNWNDALNAIREIVQISRFHPRLVESCMVLVHRGLILLLRSFRSVVVRTACQAANELFATMGNTQRPEFDELINGLLLKTADTNKSIRKDANEALDTMVINIPPVHSIRTITQKGIVHKNPTVRSASARLLVCVVGIASIEAIYDGNKESRSRVFNAAATFMQDGCQEVRNYGRRLMKMLMQHDDFDEVIQAEVNEVLFKRIEKIIVTMKYKT